MISHLHFEISNSLSSLLSILFLKLLLALFCTIRLTNGRRTGWQMLSRSPVLEHACPLFSSSYGRVSMIQVRHNKKMGAQGLFLFHTSLLCCIDQMLAVIELSQHLVSLSKTVRPIISRGARCMGHVKIMWSAVCSLAPHSHFAEKARPHLCMDNLKRPTPVRRRLSLTQAVLVKLIPIGLVLTLGM